MNLNQNLLKAICLSLSLLGLTLIYLAAVNIKPKKLELKEITPELVGRSVTTSGKIVYKNYHIAGHIFLTISDGKSKLQVPLFSGFVNKLEESGFPLQNIEKGKTMTVTGLVGEYKGELQIIPRKVEDIKIGDSNDS